MPKDIRNSFADVFISRPGLEIVQVISGFGFDYRHHIQNMIASYLGLIPEYFSELRKR